MQLMLLPASLTRTKLPFNGGQDPRIMMGEEGARMEDGRWP